jgi:hypothetical protein
MRRPRLRRRRKNSLEVTTPNQDSVACGRPIITVSSWLLSRFLCPPTSPRIQPSLSTCLYSTEATSNHSTDQSETLKQSLALFLLSGFTSCGYCLSSSPFSNRVCPYAAQEFTICPTRPAPPHHHPSPLCLPIFQYSIHEGDS